MFKKLQMGTVLSALTVLSLGVMASVAVAEPATQTTTAKTAASTTATKSTTKAKSVKKKTARKVKKGARATERFNAMDSNKNGTVSESEFVSFHKAQFKKKDKNKDGKLTKAEVSPTLAKMKK